MKIEHQNIHFASDFHIGHLNVIKFDGRPFGNLEEMHLKLIENWNSVVGENDLVFYLGDFSYKDQGYGKWFRDQLNGKIHFIMGNHDRMRTVGRLGFDRIYGDDTALGGATISVKDEEANRGYQTIVMCHYPILSWNKSHHGSWHIHGHCHQSLTKNPEMEWYYKRKVIDAGVNGLGYTPISYTELKKIMNEKIISSVDHHE
jgi:calcineurin-like phosphoesterase family protein